MGTPSAPSSDVCVTAASCVCCGRQVPAGRARRFCSPACRQAAYRRRHQPDTPEVLALVQRVTIGTTAQHRAAAASPPTAG